MIMFNVVQRLGVFLVHSSKSLNQPSCVKSGACSGLSWLLRESLETKLRRVQRQSRPLSYQDGRILLCLWHRGFSHLRPVISPIFLTQAYRPAPESFVSSAIWTESSYSLRCRRLGTIINVVIEGPGLFCAGMTELMGFGPGMSGWGVWRLAWGIWRWKCTTDLPEMD